MNTHKVIIQMLLMTSFIDDSELDDDTFYFDDYGNITHFNDDNIAEAEAELHYTLADLGKLRIYS